MSFCNIDAVDVKVLQDYKLYLQFDDGSQGEVDIAKLISFEGVFEPLKDKTYFNSVSVNSEIGTICWDNGADISPSFLHKQIISAA